MSQSIIINKNVVSSQNDADLAYTVNSINGNYFACFLVMKSLDNNMVSYDIQGKTTIDRRQEFIN